MTFHEMIGQLHTHSLLRCRLVCQSAPTRFQKFVNKVVEELIRDALVYIDDFLIAIEMIEHYLQLLKRVLKLMVENKLNLRIDKCKFLFTKIEYLGYSISSQEISPTDSGIETVFDTLSFRYFKMYAMCNVSWDCVPIFVNSFKH